MKPYYEDNFGKLYNEDCFDVMDFFLENDLEFQLIFADPPYGIGKADWDKFENQEEYLKWTVKWVRKAGRLLKKNSSLFTMDFPEELADVKYRLVREVDWIDSFRWISWHYRNKPQPGDSDFSRSHESLLWLRKSEDWKFYMDRIRVPYNIHTRKYPERSQGESSMLGGEGSEGYEWDPHIEGAKPRDVLDVPVVNNPSKENVDHPTQKPEELLRKIIWAVTDKNDLVYDPFGGSGTTYVVCEQLGRRWRGSEIREEDCELTVERLEKLQEKNDPEFWAKHDFERVQHRRKVRGGS